VANLWKEAQGAKDPVADVVGGYQSRFGLPQGDSPVTRGKQARKGINMPKMPQRTKIYKQTQQSIAKEYLAFTAQGRKAFESGGVVTPENEKAFLEQGEAGQLPQGSDFMDWIISQVGSGKLKGSKYKPVKQAIGMSKWAMDNAMNVLQNQEMNPKLMENPMAQHWALSAAEAMGTDFRNRKPAQKAAMKVKGGGFKMAAGPPVMEAFDQAVEDPEQIPEELQKEIADIIKAREQGRKPDRARLNRLIKKYRVEGKGFDLPDDVEEMLGLKEEPKKKVAKAKAKKMVSPFDFDDFGRLSANQDLMMNLKPLLEKEGVGRNKTRNLDIDDTDLKGVDKYLSQFTANMRRKGVLKEGEGIDPSKFRDFYKAVRQQQQRKGRTKIGDDSRFDTNLVRMAAGIEPGVLQALVSGDEEAINALAKRPSVDTTTKKLGAYQGINLSKTGARRAFQNTGYVESPKEFTQDVGTNLQIYDPDTIDRMAQTQNLIADMSEFEKGLGKGNTLNKVTGGKIKNIDQMKFTELDDIVKNFGLAEKDAGRLKDISGTFSGFFFAQHNLLQLL